MKVTYQQIITFRQNARQYIAESGTKNNYLLHALNRMLEYEYTEKHEKKFKKINDDLRVEHALVKDGCFVRDKNNNIEIDPKLAKKYNEAILDLHGKVVEIEPYLAKAIPEDMPFAYYSVFVPFIIENIPEPEGNE